WFYQFDYMKYLFIVIPGTMIGDLTYRWMKERSPANDRDNAFWRRSDLAALSVLGCAVILMAHVGVQERIVGLTTLVLGLGLGLALWNWRNPGTATERYLKELLAHGTAWLLIGLLFDEYEGGAKKTWGNMAYF